MAKEMERDRLLKAIDRGRARDRCGLFFLGLVLIRKILACVPVNTVYVQTGNYHCNQCVEQRYFAGINCFLIQHVGMATEQTLEERRDLPCAPVS